MNIVIKFRETSRETFRSIFRAALPLTLLFCLNLPNFAQSCIGKKGKITVRSANACIEGVYEKGISSQIFSMANTALRRANAKGRRYELVIDVSEYSFYKPKKLERTRSLYAHYQLFSESGECVLEKVFCSQGKKTLLSAFIQKDRVAWVARGVKSYVRSGKAKRDAR